MNRESISKTGMEGKKRWVKFLLLSRTKSKRALCSLSPREVGIYGILLAVNWIVRIHCAIQFSLKSMLFQSPVLSGLLGQSRAGEFGGVVSKGDIGI